MLDTLHSINYVLASEMKPRLFDLDLQLGSDAILTMISVFVLFLVMSHLLFNPVREMMEKRKRKIAEELDYAATNRDDAIKMKAEYQDKLKDINKEAEEILSEARKKALANENRIVSEAKEEAARIIQRANVEAELEKKKVADEVKREIVSIASAMAGKIVSASIDISAQNSLIEETLKEIGESTWLS